MDNFENIVRKTQIDKTKAKSIYIIYYNTLSCIYSKEIFLKFELILSLALIKITYILLFILYIIFLIQR